MEIYVGHSGGFDYKEKLYRPIRESCLNGEHNFVLPHEFSNKPFDSKKYLKDKCDLFIADVSYPSIPLGIELGWADAYGVPVIYTYQRGSKLSSSLKVVGEDFLEYSSGDGLIFALEEMIG